MRSGRTLRQIVRERIIAQVPGLTGVYDKATESSAYPYATLGPSYGIDDSAVGCIEGREITLQVDVWGSATNKGVVEDLTDDVATALKGHADIAALTMHPLELVTAQVSDDFDGVSVHGMVIVRAMVEA